MSYKSGAKGGNRNFGLHGAAGKGDSDRTDNRKKFNENFGEIQFSGVEFSQTRKAGRLIKKYK